MIPLAIFAGITLTGIGIISLIFFWYGKKSLQEAEGIANEARKMEYDVRKRIADYNAMAMEINNLKTQLNAKQKYYE